VAHGLEMSLVGGRHVAYLIVIGEDVCVLFAATLCCDDMCVGARG
jgi:hypothetical protein